LSGVTGEWVTAKTELDIRILHPVLAMKIRDQINVWQWKKKCIYFL